MAKNKNLHQAKTNKKDEFYTQLSDIENELKHYKAHFKDKIVLCNCDDPLISGFFQYFFLNFAHLGLRELICTCYKNVNYDLFSTESSPEKAVGIKIDTLNYSEAKSLLSLSLSSKPTQNDIKTFEQNRENLKSLLFELKSDSKYLAGDFRSKDCIELLKSADIVVTNPPFSLFREYVAQLIEYGKKFVIVAHQNAVSYKEIFKLIKENKLWLGYGFKGGAAHFINYHYEDYATASNHKEGMIRVSGVIWLTNLDIKKRHELLETIHSYSKTPEKYPKYDNYDAINVDKTSEIPLDYEGVMGVPITFLDKHNPQQFEIVGKMSTTGIDEFNFGYPYINRQKIYARILIRKIQHKGE